MAPFSAINPVVVNTPVPIMLATTVTEAAVRPNVRRLDTTGALKEWTAYVQVSPSSLEDNAGFHVLEAISIGTRAATMMPASSRASNFRGLLDMRRIRFTPK